MSAEPEYRRARTDDYAHFVRLFRELGVDDPVPESELWIREMAGSTRFLESDGRVVAYVHFELLRTAGYVRHVVVDPLARRRGFGRAILRAVERELAAAGCVEWRLNVLSSNTVAIELYESLGLCAVHPTWILRFPWSSLERLERASPQVSSRRHDPAEDAAVERALSLAEGQLASFRQRSGQLLLRLDDARRPGVVAGFARFDPSYPGAFPFRLRDAGEVRALLEAMRAHARPGQSWVGLAVEQDEELARTLRAAGAELKLEITHMQGPLAR
jgi:GNAT superfamily N-acetyltransferase